MAKQYRDLIVGLDIGTSKVMTLVAEMQSDHSFKVLGLGVAPSEGMKRGVVVNIEACVQSIQQAVREAELMAGCKITRTITGITGSHIRGRNSSGMVAIRDREVTQQDIKKVLEAAQTINLGTDQHPLLVEAQEFVLDDQEIKVPLGMSGVRLESKVHIVTCAQSAAENLLKCVRRCGLEVDRLMVNPVAASTATLTPDERELGVVLVDIGAGTTDIAVYHDGTLRHTAVLPVAGELITNDIAMALRTPTSDAEDIKLQSGCAKQLMADPEAHIEVTGLSDHPPRLLSKQVLAGVIEPRVEEIFSLVREEVRQSGYEHLVSSGVVLTGGSALMQGMVALGEDTFLKPVRIAHSQYQGALADMVTQPQTSVVMGMLQEACQEQQSSYTAHQKIGNKNFWKRVRDLVIKHF